MESLVLVVGWIRRLVSDAIAAARGLRSPRRLSLLIGGNLVNELLFAAALGAFARALGYDIGLAELVFINVSVSLLSGLIPVPGGIGVVEGGLTYGLVRAGMPEEAAFAAVLMYRLATFYLPPIWASSPCAGSNAAGTSDRPPDNGGPPTSGLGSGSGVHLR